MQQQAFKEIPYQNYVELRFNEKNLHEITQQQALIRYKRNAKVLAQLFTFEKPAPQSLKTQCNLTQEQLQQFQQQMKDEQKQMEQKLQKVEKNSEKFEQLLEKSKKLKSKQQMEQIIQQLKIANMYDETHPFFAQSSPFFLNFTDADFLEVKDTQFPTNQTMDLLQIN